MRTLDTLASLALRTAHADTYYSSKSPNLGRSCNLHPHPRLEAPPGGICLLVPPLIIHMGCCTQRVSPLAGILERQPIDHTRSKVHQLNFDIIRSRFWLSSDEYVFRLDICAGVLAQLIAHSGWSTFTCMDNALLMNECKSFQKLASGRFDLVG